VTPPSAKAPRLELAGVRREFGDGPERVGALRGVDLSIAPGEFVSVEGPSGCGKTTLLNLVGLLDRPTAGSVGWDGTVTTGWGERDRARTRLARVGFIFQRFYLLPGLTARENVELPLKAIGVAGPARRARALAVLSRVGLGPRSGAFPHELSGGEEQRVAIARALANDPGLLLADEPTGELDRANTDTVLDLLVDAHRTLGATVIVVTHNARVAERAERHLAMEDGRLVGDRQER